MADQDETESPEAEVDSEASGGKKKKLIIFIVVVLVVLGGAAGITLYMLMGSGETAGEGDSSAESQKATKPPAIYFAMEPPFTVDFQVGGRQRYAQLSITVMGRDPEAMAAVKQHEPLIRNNLVLLIASEDFQTLQTSEGKEMLKQKATESIQQVLQQEIGKPGIETVLFTGFVMQ
ncbi:flagellar basal body-associated FliL family protein [Zooshikella harenae]|uniref:Flagellar protein FliL n=1 Tax=Zooshikella harenae TaxID=2827238 RepID=A0ABS5ZB26_9GAMM|nr:flagellar basal body-associated FliL family protein [Zooshikella harenae]MBU2710445.1 flagellar basal body-associated FliL family protein [Zooshikella harenae]